MKRVVIVWIKRRWRIGELSSRAWLEIYSPEVCQYIGSDNCADRNNTLNVPTAQLSRGL